MPRRPVDDHPALNLDEALDALFSGEPEGFIPARDQLVKRLRVEGRRDDAARVKALRRPSVAVWAVNQVVRRRRDDVARLAELGAHLRQVQAETFAAGGGADRLRTLGADRRALIAALGDEAMAVLRARDTAPEPHRDDIAATFEAVAADPDAATRVLAGRLTRPLQPPVGFGAPNGVVVALGDDTGKRVKGRGGRAAEPKATGSSVHVLDAVEVRKARARAARAHEVLETAEREVARMEAALTTARQELARAREAAARADAAARAAESAADRADD